MYMDKYNTNGKYINELFTDNPVIQDTVQVPSDDVIRMVLNNTFLLLKTNKTIPIDKIYQFNYISDLIEIKESNTPKELYKQYQDMKINLLNKYQPYFLELEKNNIIESFVIIDFIFQCEPFIIPEYKEL